MTQLSTFLSSNVDFPSALQVSLVCGMMIAEVWERFRGKQHRFHPKRSRKEDKAGTDSRNHYLLQKKKYFFLSVLKCH